MGTFPVTVKVDLPDFPMIPPYSTSFDIFIFCQVVSISEVIAPPPTSQFLIGVDPFLSFPIHYEHYPNCDVTYSLSPDPSTFGEWDINLVRGYPGSIGLQTKNFKAAGTYPMVLHIDPTDGVSVGQSLAVPFELKLIDLCEDTTFAPFKLPDMEIFRQEFAKFTNDQENSFVNLKTYAELLGADCGLVYFDL